MYFLCVYKLFILLFPQMCPQGRNNRSDDSTFTVSSSLLFTENPSREYNLPDTASNPFVYLEKYNYPYENHTIITEDGYILLTVRIPHGKRKSRNRKRPPVVFVHGIFCTFYDFLNAGTEKAIGFRILEEGYDLWLMNTRGNTYSRRHVSLDPVLNASEYWNFSWHEVGFYDVPANMDYIANVTGFTNVSMVGHSQGGTVYLALAASRPEYDKRITFSLQLAPVSYLKNAKQPILNAMKDNIDIFDAIVAKYNLNEIFPRTQLFIEFGQRLCNIDSPLTEVCASLFKFIGGPSDQLNGSLIAVLATNDPAGASVKQVRHYIQIAISDNFQLYDYGSVNNRIIYNQKTPPLYNLSAITSSVAIYYGKNDYFISLVDGARLAAEIPSALHFVLGRGTNHLDVQWGSKAVEEIHKPAIKLMNMYNKL